MSRTLTPRVPVLATQVAAAADRETAQLIVIAAVTITSVLLLIAILCITASAVVDRFCPHLARRRRRDDGEEDADADAGLECRVYLHHDPQSGNITGVIKHEFVQRPEGSGQRRAQGYEQMVGLGRDGEHIYESVQ